MEFAVYLAFNGRGTAKEEADTISAVGVPPLVVCCTTRHAPGAVPKSSKRRPIFAVEAGAIRRLEKNRARRIRTSLSHWARGRSLPLRGAKVHVRS